MNDQPGKKEAAVAHPPPASPVSAIDLDALETEHIRWLDSGGKEGKRANLRGGDLSGVNLSGRRFAEASLRGSNFTDADLTRADLRAADLSEANFARAKLENAQLAGASLARAQLAGSQAAQADLAGADLTGATAEGIVLTGAQMRAAVLRDGNFSQASLQQAQLTDANLRGTTLAHADLSHADLTNADCRDAQCEQTRFDNAMLRGALFRGAKLAGVDMQAGDFTVALEVDAELLAAASRAERSKLKEEQGRMEKRKNALEVREQTLSREKAGLQDKAEKFEQSRLLQSSQTKRLSRYTKAFLFCGVLWLLFAGSILVFTINIAMQMRNINSPRLAYIVGAAGFALLLALFSMVRSLQIAHAIRQFSASSIDGSPDLEEVSESEESTSVPAPQSPRTADKSGFGKKK